jgi:hypothetical protein
MNSHSNHATLFWLGLVLSITLAIVFLLPVTPSHLLESFNRYLMAIFLFFLVQATIRSQVLRIAIWVGSFGLQPLLLTGFLDWRWIA